MSTTGIQDQPKFYNKKSSFHGRNDSDELDVFEAARYFSGYNEQVYNVTTTTNYTQKSMRGGGGGRISLDLPMMRNSLPQDSNYKKNIDVHQKKPDKKYKQPSSPGGRLASFLNSLFNQTGSKKKKSKSTTQSMKDDIDDDQSPNSMRRRRRSSVSHFRSSNSTSADTKSLYSSSSSGFRTPPPAYAQTPIKSLRSFSDQKKQLLLPSQVCVKPGTGKLISHDRHHKRNQDLYENKVKFSDGSAEKKKEQLRKLNDHVIDDGAESDSSSDLFELENCDLGFYSSGLPVYETTHMDTIKRSEQPIITTGAL